MGVQKRREEIALYYLRFGPAHGGLQSVSKESSARSDSFGRLK